MDDDQFLGYVEIHSHTERALFTVSQIRRLFDLAEVSCPIRLSEDPERWYTLDYYDAKPLVDKARTRLTELRTNERLFPGFVEGDPA